MFLCSKSDRVVHKPCVINAGKNVTMLLFSLLPDNKKNWLCRYMDCNDVIVHMYA